MSTGHYAVDSCLRSFDFAKVHELMKFMAWEWGHSVPSLIDIVDTGRRILLESWNKAAEVQDTCFYSTGGLEAKTWFGEEYGAMSCELKFVAIESESWEDKDEDGEMY